MAQAAIEKFEEIFTCSICLDKPTDPKILSCHHTFCQTCIQDVYDREVGIIQPFFHVQKPLTCPLCKHKTVLTEHGIQALSSDFRANQVSSLLEELRLGNERKSEETPHKKCYVCSKVSADVDAKFVCFDCSKALCESCFEQHGKNPRFASHVYSSVKTEDIPSIICREHDDLFQAFCMDCETGICQVCLLKTHSAHDIHQIERRSNKFENAEKTTEMNREEALDKEFLCARRRLEQMQMHYKTTVTKQHAICEAVKRDIHNHKAEIIKLLEKEEKRLFEILDRQQLQFGIDCVPMNLNITAALVRLDSVEHKRTLIITPFRTAADVILSDSDKLLTVVLGEFDGIKSLNIPRKSCPNCTFEKGKCSIGSVKLQ